MAISDFRVFIQEEYQHRRAGDPSLSLSEFSRQLGMSPQKMNSIMNQSGGLSSEAALELAEKLPLHGHRRDLFIALVDSVHHRSALVRQTALSRVQALVRDGSFETLKVSEFAAISAWFEIATCMLPDLADFQGDPAWIAHRLGISIEQASATCEKLFALGLFREDGARWVRDSESFNIEFEKPNLHAREFHKQMAAKGAEFLKRNPDDDRHFATAHVAVTAQDMSFIREQIEIFQKELLSKIAQRGGINERIWSLNFHCFPVDDPKGHHD